MFFFIGGIQPKTIDIDGKPLICPSCGLLRARYKRVDHYLSLFFIPVIPVKKGDPFLYCESCGIQSPGKTNSGYENNAKQYCKNCGRKLESDFMYCPFCGKLL
ncbi:MAG: zinc ribbon domain-containing protein [Deltaproteobacteria bacterium]|nr:zinc ribbon domain-containing protein [Deltaproteobacteria bacterium]